MNRWMKLELVFLAVILIIALVACIGIPMGALAPAVAEQPLPVETTAESQPEETTEPAPTWMTFPADRELTATQAFVYDCDKREFLYITGEPEDQVYPASITKLFTAHVALQFLEPEQVITAGDALEMVGYGSSVAEIQYGDTLTAEQLVEAMLLPSGNDAAYLLAVETGRAIEQDPSLPAPEAVDIFLREMNGQARVLGLSGTHFTNPDGYHDPNHYTSMQDMATIGRLAMENPVVMKYASIPEDRVTLSGGEKIWKNTNALIHPESEYYCPYVTGLKTGQTPSAGSCLLSSLDVQGKRWIIGVFGCPEVEDRFADTLQLLNKTLGIQ